MYNDKVMDHFFNPRNVGELENPDGVGQVGNPVCGDTMRITLKIKDNRIEDIKFRTFGCGAAIATSSMVTELVKGLTLEEALEVSNKQVAESLGGLPPQKLHCSNLAAEAVHAAIQDYYKKQGLVVSDDNGSSHDHSTHDHSVDDESSEE
ncbi:MAG TPA: Fe-S cluster assembly scaffold protein NifU [Firmicutes bacterium]|jgi:nitrogen fixation NifU-like protein|nr:Fe-S cluster assembly scaffold protein NifU [Bacillota bacterium]